MKKIIYINPNFDSEDINIDEFGRLEEGMKVFIAKNYKDDTVSLMSVEDFCSKFNNEEISDLGYVFPVNYESVEQSNKDHCLHETIALLSGDIFAKLYYSKENYAGNCCLTAQEIIRLAKEFERNHSDDDDEDYLTNLEKFEKQVLRQIKAAKKDR